MTTKAQFWFDPACPWAWMTSRWILEVARQREIDVQWNIFSLAVLNEGRELTPEYRARTDKTWGPVRVVAAVKRKYGAEKVLPIYTEIGKLFHPGAKPIEKETVLQALKNLNLDESLINVYDTTEVDQDLRDSTKAALDLVGSDVGTPVIAVEGVAFFGPVITPAPKGEAALKLWDAVIAAASVPGFFELKRTRTARPQFD
jgi:2-hydroxychromene-2-carboxylate isomerase